MLDVFDPYRALYSPHAHKRFPWWVNNLQVQGSIHRWVRADRTWEVSVDTHIIGEITVRRLDLDEHEDYEEVERLRQAVGWYGPPSWMASPAVLAGLQKNPAIIERIPLSDERFAPKPGVNPCSVDGYSQMAPAGTGPEGKLTYPDVWSFVDQTLLRLDREHPMPRPPVWPGQLWAQGFIRPHMFIAADFSSEEFEKMPFTALLYGPSTYGRDVPWLATEHLPPVGTP